LPGLIRQPGSFRIARRRSRSSFSSRFPAAHELEHGFAISATGYPGLGTPCSHPYLVGESEGRAVLDSIRAAHALPGSGIGIKASLWGHSQGGQAVLFAAKLAKTYAPEFNIVGVVAAAPATELRCSSIPGWLSGDLILQPQPLAYMPTGPFWMAPSNRLSADYF